MHFLNLLPFAAVFAAALPEVKTPGKDIAVAKRQTVPCDTYSNDCDNSNNNNNNDPYADYHYDIHQLQGVVIYDLKVEGTTSSYSVSFWAWNPNTNWITPCSTSVQNVDHYQSCQRLRTKFHFDIDDNELAQTEATVEIKIIWGYSPGALPNAMLHGGGDRMKYKDLTYYQTGEAQFNVDCIPPSTGGSPGSGQGGYIPDPVAADVSNSKLACPAPGNGPCPSNKKSNAVSCKFTGSVAASADTLVEGEYKE